MSLSALIQKGGLGKIATATVAIPATDGRDGGGIVAGVATIAIASPTELKPETNFHPLSDRQLGRLISDTAKANRLDPLVLWRWCDLDLIGALRAGDPAEIRAFRFAVSLPTWDGLPPAVPHGIPFPGGLPHQPLRSATGSGEVGLVTCGACAHFQEDSHGFGGIGRCAANVPARPGWSARYPKAERYCRAFLPVTQEHTGGIGAAG